MNRTRWLLLLSLILITANVAYFVWARWGLITIHAEQKPLSEIIRSIEKQGHVVVKTNLDPSTPVRIHLDLVPAAEALETLAAVTDARWRLTYIFAPAKAGISTYLGKIATGERPEGWRTVYYPLPSIAESDDDSVPDPRKDTWTVQAPTEKTLGAYLEQGGQSVSASFVVPEDWNPAITGKLSSGRIGAVARKLASAAKGQMEEIFLLQGNRGGARDGERGDGPRWAGRGGNREGMLARMKAEIAKLPPEKQAAAQTELDERQAMFAGVRDLPPEERRAKMEEVFSHPAMQERMEKRDNARDSRSSPEQRMKRAQRYVERKQQAKNGGQ